MVMVVTKLQTPKSSKIRRVLPEGIGVDHAQCCDCHLPDLLNCLCPDQRDNLAEQVPSIELVTTTAVQQGTACIGNK